VTKVLVAYVTGRRVALSVAARPVRASTIGGREYAEVRGDSCGCGGAGDRLQHDGYRRAIG